jgi:hypothetical protein
MSRLDVAGNCVGGHVIHKFASYVNIDDHEIANPPHNTTATATATATATPPSKLGRKRTNTITMSYRGGSGNARGRGRGGNYQQYPPQPPRVQQYNQMQDPHQQYNMNAPYQHTPNPPSFQQAHRQAPRPAHNQVLHNLTRPSGITRRQRGVRYTPDGPQKKRPELECAWCTKKGHSLKDCNSKVDQYGFVRRCPRP